MITTIRTNITRLFIVFLSVLSVSTTMAQEQNQYALYNYRNDGDFNAWLNIDVDSITYSCIGLDSVEYETPVVQEVWTPDSLYRIPIAVIDSIGFKAPKPVMASNIFYIRDYHAPYTTSIEGLTIQLNKSIHRDSIPSVGQVILSATEMAPYEEGFAGKVVDVQYGASEITIVCEEISIGDIYKRLVLVGKVTNDIENLPSNIRRKGLLSSDPWVNIEDFGVKTFDLDEKEFSIGNYVKITSPTPKLTCTYSVYISEVYYEVYINIDLYHPNLTYTFTVTADQLAKYAKYGKLFVTSMLDDKALDEWLNEYMNTQLDKYLKEEEEENKELTKEWFKKSKITIPIPIPSSGVLNLDLEISPILKAKGQLEIASEFKTDAWQSMSMKWKGFTPLKLVSSTFGIQDIPDVTVSARQDPFKSAKLDLKAKGTLTLGFKTLLDVNLIHKKVLYAGLACDFALMEVGGTLDFTAIDTEQPEMNLYDRFKDSNIKISSYAKGYAEAGMSPFDFLHIKTGKMKLYKKENVLNIFPHFTEPVLPKFNNGTWQGKKPLSFFTYPSKDIFIPCKIGMRILDEDGNIVKGYLNTYRYLDEFDWQNKYLDIDVSDLKSGCSYKCYPIISFFGLKPFNAGPHHNFYTPIPLSALPKALTIREGSNAEVEIVGGWDTFSVVIEEGDKYASIIKDNGNVSPRVVKILGKKEGTASLKIEDRRSKQVVHVPITVSNGVIPVTSIILSDTSLTIQPGGTRTITATVLPENATNKSVTWKSNKNDVATVDENGVVTAVAEGTCTIRCYATDGSGIKKDCSVTVSNDFIPVTSITLSDTSLTLQPGGTRTITATVLPENATNKTVTWKSNKNDVATVDSNGVVTAVAEGTCTIRCYATDGSGIKTDCSVTVTSGTIPDAGNHEYVDLGLPSGTLWATCNVGASKPEEYGDYFAWGETKPKSDYSWSTYKWGSDYDQLTKYCTKSYYGLNGFTDNKTTLDLADDAARANWGGKWRMPTSADFDELLNNTSNQWVTNYNGTGVNGRLFTANNGKSIFLPAAGWRYGKSLGYAGSYGGYWSRSLSTDDPYCACDLYFNSGYVGVGSDDYSRYYGRTVRPVRP